jgi:hypothetical protein
MEPNAEHPQRRLISDPSSPFRKIKLITRFIGPVETFQSASELIDMAARAGADCEKLIYTQSDYDHLSWRQRLQRVYSSALKPILPQRYLLPNYFVAFRKRKN